MYCFVAAGLWAMTTPGGADDGEVEGEESDHFTASAGTSTMKI